MDNTSLPQEQGSDFDVAGANLLQNGVGWAWGTQANKLALYRTADSGVHWQKVPLPAPPKLSETDTTGGVGIGFADTDHVWLAYAINNAPLVTYRTSDSGKSWRKSSVGIKGMSTQIQFLDENTGWILLHQGAAMMHEEVSLLHTTDGGASWQVLAKTAPNASGLPPGTIPFTGTKNGYTFRDESNGYLSTYEPTPGKISLFATSDTGKTWKARSVPTGSEFSQADFSSMPPIFFGGKDGILPVIVNSKDKLYFLVYVTHDGGYSWDATTPIASAHFQPWTWSFSDVQHGFVTDGSRLITTTNSGRTWTTRKLEKQLTGTTQILELHFASSLQGWAVVSEQVHDTTSQPMQSAPGVNITAPTRGGLFRTTDGGLTWEKVRF